MTNDAEHDIRHETKMVYVKRWRTLVRLPAKYADEIVAALRIPDAAQGSVLSQIEAEARRYAGMYPQSSDGRNTFVIFADWVATLAAQPPAAPAERGCCNKCQKASECETGCKLACTCGGDPGQPASEHDISCPAGLQRSSADTAQELERLREVAHAVEGLLNADTYVSNVPRAEAVRNATIKLNQKLGIWQMHHTAQKAESAR